MEYFELLKAGAAKGSAGGGFTPTQPQLDAMNSGITSGDVAQINSSKSITDRIVMANNENTKIYIQATEPTGDIPEGSLWFNTAVVNP